MDLAAEQGRYPLWPNSPGDRVEIVVHVPAPISPRHRLGEPKSQLNSDPAARGRHQRPGHGIHMRQEASQPHLAGTPALSHHLAQLRAAARRPRRGRHRAEERTGRNGYRDERIRLHRSSAAGRRSPRRTAPAGPPDRRPQGHAPSPIPLRLVSSQAFTTGVCTSSTPRPNRLPRARTTTLKRTCPNLRTADIPPPHLAETRHCQTWPRSGARERGRHGTPPRGGTSAADDYADPHRTARQIGYLTSRPGCYRSHRVGSQAQWPARRCPAPPAAAVSVGTLAWPGLHLSRPARSGPGLGPAALVM